MAGFASEEQMRVTFVETEKKIPVRIPPPDAPTVKTPPRLTGDVVTSCLSLLSDRDILPQNKG
jgi:hypothetical protein